VSALVDWFTLIFFTGCALIIWVVWLSLQTGIPAQPAINVARLFPGFVHHFSPTTLVIASIASIAWAWLVFWRVGKHRAAIWKSVILPAGGAALCWLLLLTLWLPMLDFARSNAPLVSQAQTVIPKTSTCVATLQLSRSQLAALHFHGGWTLEPLTTGSRCEWLITDLADTDGKQVPPTPPTGWQWRATIGHPAERHASLIVYQRQSGYFSAAPAGTEK
jgi:hypothetical protein